MRLPSSPRRQVSFHLRTQCASVVYASVMQTPDDVRRPPRTRVWALLLAALALSGCAGQRAMAPGSAAASTSAGSYAELGLSPSVIQSWEDGMRTTGRPGTYEWWYFDFTLDDGSTVVIVYYTKDFTRPGSSLQPFVSFQMETPGSPSVTRFIAARPAEFAAAKDGCDVRIGASTVRGDLHDYTLHLEGGDLRADLTLHGTVPPWRPRTGHMVFQKGTSHYFAWLPSVPHGRVQGTIVVGGATRAVSGTGYHDHNWGDVSMLELIHDWYWGRAQVGDYTVIASYITARAEYGSAPIPLFMLARDGAVLVDDASKVRFEASDVYTDGYTAKPVAGKLVYNYDDGTSRYRVTFSRERDINRTRFVDGLRGVQALLARVAGFDGAYLRFTGPATVERMQGDRVVETATERSAVWELMYFGHAPAQVTAQR
jgi:hypothetical protein